MTRGTTQHGPSRRSAVWMLLLFAGLCAGLFTACADEDDDGKTNVTVIGAVNDDEVSGDDDTDGDCPNAKYDERTGKYRCGPNDDADDDDSSGDVLDDDTADDDTADDDTTDDDTGDDDGPDPRLLELYDILDFEQYLDIEPVDSEDAFDNFTRYFFPTDRVRCFDGSQASVSISPGDNPDNVMIFLEGGGARWPGGGVALTVDVPIGVGFRSRSDNNPLRDWTIVYVPYCDASIHSGDNELEYEGEGVRYHHGLRHSTASIALAKQLYPDAKKVLVAGSSAGGFGTFFSWVIARSQFPDAQTYILDDSGQGFWNPDDLETFETIKQAWDLRLPEDICTKCGITEWTYAFDLYMQYDPRVRIGLVSWYQDSVIGGVFLQMDPMIFEQTLVRITDDIRATHPDRFARFFMEGSLHTVYMLVLTGKGLNYEIDDVSLAAWIDGLVSDDPSWPDLTE
ncbi:MAG: hypothetical protein H6683_00480 [Deltaproteobacteria bacterium]|nr:hypothetical protein [Deltaproteobacteria bacterium]